MIARVGGMQMCALKCKMAEARTRGRRVVVSPRAIVRATDRVCRKSTTLNWIVHEI